jgi:glycosyltransferase involved in cell wall biosynthesis
LDIALDAVRMVRQNGTDLRLTIAGHFWEPIDSWRRRIDAARLSDAVSLQPGYVSDAELTRLFASHHLVLLPYRTATGSGIVPLARAADRLVVATAVGGLSEAIQDGRDGTLASRPEPGAFADAIVRALALEPETRTAMPGTTWAEVAHKVVELAG